MHMRRCAWSVGILLLAGCVERRYVITTDPPGAVVLRNNQPIGASPADDHFVYYGNYHFTIQKEGYETLQVDQKIPAPWYQWFPLDLVSEILVPWPIEDVRRFNYKLEPRHIPNANDVLGQAQNLRNRGFSLGAGGTVPVATANAPPPAVPPATAPAAPPP
jgi:hypothetical protein